MDWETIKVALEIASPLSVIFAAGSIYQQHRRVIQDLNEVMEYVTSARTKDEAKELRISNVERMQAKLERDVHELGKTVTHLRLDMARSGSASELSPGDSDS